jgi:hypothetical protein
MIPSPGSRGAVENPFFSWLKGQATLLQPVCERLIQSSCGDVGDRTPQCHCGRNREEWKRPLWGSGRGYYRRLSNTIRPSRTALNMLAKLSSVSTMS